MIGAKSTLIGCLYLKTMCYDIKTKLAYMLKRARHQGDENRIKELEEAILPYLEDEIFHVSGFSHPQMMIYTTKSQSIPELAYWGLIPKWVKDHAQKVKIWNGTLNARGETIFEKPSFRNAAHDNRAVIYLSGFFEHHHQGGKTYPFLIQKKDEGPIVLACLAEDWVDKSTGEIIKSFSIVTTKGNDLMSKIHNNPKLNEPRMPVILEEENVDAWLNGTKLDLKDLMRPYPKNDLIAHTVRRLRGKERVGNVSEAAEIYPYEELVLTI